MKINLNQILRLSLNPYYNGKYSMSSNGFKVSEAQSLS